MPLDMLVDTGATVSLVNKVFDLATKKRSLLKVKRRLIAANGESLQVYGETSLKFMLQGHLVTHDVIVCDLPGDCPLPTPTKIAPVPAPSEPVASGSGVNFKRRKDIFSPYQVQILQEVFAEHINQNSIKIADIRESFRRPQISANFLKTDQVQEQMRSKVWCLIKLGRKK